MAKKKAAKECSCIDSVQEQLKTRGVRVVRHLQMKFELSEGRMSPPSIVIEKIGNTKAKMPTVFCSYCPFCGKAYQ